MLNRFFDPDHVIWRTVGKLVDVVVLSMLWLILCIPVCTIGPASAALYHTAVKHLRRNESAPYAGFLRSFRENLKVGVPASLIAAGLMALLAYEYVVMETLAATGEPRYIALFVAFYVILVLPVGLIGLLFALLSRFACSLKQLLGNTLKIGLKHLFGTVMIGLIVFEMTVFSLEHIYVVPFTPAITALIVSLFAERILKRYTPQEGCSTQEDEENRPWYLK